jgi:hypothetical protein
MISLSPAARACHLLQHHRGGSDPTSLSVSTTGNVTFTGAVNTAGNVQITNSGVLTILDTTSTADDVSADINVLGSFTQTSGGGGSSVSLRGHRDECGQFHKFQQSHHPTGNVLLQANGTGNITLSSTVNPTTASIEGLRLYTDSGSISVTEPVGSSNQLGALTITSAGDATFMNDVTATSFAQVAGTGTTTLMVCRTTRGTLVSRGRILYRTGLPQ